MSVCVCSHVCVSFVHYCVVVYVFGVLFVCVCACLFAKRFLNGCLRVSVWCCKCFLFLCVVCCVCACGAECVYGLRLVSSLKLSFFFFLRVFVCC